MQADHVRALQSLPLFAGVSVEDLKTFAAPPRRYHKGGLIFQQGDPADAFFLILDGWVKVFRHSLNGEEIVLNVFTRGETFAEIAMFAHGNYPASAEVVDEARIIRISAHLMIDRIRNDPKLAINMLASMSNHMRRLVEQIEQLKGLSGPQRLAAFLLRQCDSDEGTAVVRLPYDKFLIAGRLGMKPESLSRALMKLRSLGVRSEQNKVIISDVEALFDFCEEDRTSQGSQRIRMP